MRNCHIAVTEESLAHRIFCGTGRSRNQAIDSTTKKTYTLLEQSSVILLFLLLFQRKTDRVRCIRIVVLLFFFVVGSFVIVLIKLYVYAFVLFSISRP